MGGGRLGQLRLESLGRLRGRVALLARRVGLGLRRLARVLLLLHGLLTLVPPLLQRLGAAGRPLQLARQRGQLRSELGGLGGRGGGLSLPRLRLGGALRLLVALLRRLAHPRHLQRLQLIAQGGRLLLGLLQPLLGAAGEGEGGLALACSRHLGLGGGQLRRVRLRLAQLALLLELLPRQLHLPFEDGNLLLRGRAGLLVAFHFELARRELLLARIQLLLHAALLALHLRRRRLVPLGLGRILLPPFLLGFQREALLVPGFAYFIQLVIILAEGFRLALATTERILQIDHACIGCACLLALLQHLQALEERLLAALVEGVLGLGALRAALRGTWRQPLLAVGRGGPGSAHAMKKEEKCTVAGPTVRRDVIREPTKSHLL